MHIYTHIQIYTHTYKYIHTHTNMHIHIHAYIHTHTNIYMHSTYTHFTDIPLNYFSEHFASPDIDDKIDVLQLQWKELVVSSLDIFYWCISCVYTCSMQNGCNLYH